MTKIYFKRGFSLPELMISLAFMGIVASVSYTTFQLLDESTKDEVNEIQYLIEKLGAERIIHQDIALATNSFNQLNLKDGNGRLFYDFIQYPYCKSNCKRELTLNLSSNEIRSSYFYILTINTKKGLKFSVNPKGMFYQDADGQVDINQYLGINPATENSPDIGCDLEADPPAQSLWCKSEMVALYTNVNFSSKLNPNSPARPFFIWGVVDNSQVDIIPLFPKDENGEDILRKENPLIPTHSINSPQDFLQSLSVTPGQSFSLYLEGVDLVRYHIERKNIDSSKTFLIRSVARFTPDTNEMTFESKKHVLAYDIESLTFTRDTISSPSIGFSIKRLDK